MSVRTRKIGKKWYYNFDIYVNGKRKIIEKVGGLTKKEAIENGEIERLKYIDNIELYSSKIKILSDLIEEYIKDYINIFLKESTRKNRMYHINKINKDIGQTKLSDINTRFLQNYILDTSDPNNIKKIFKALFNYAIRLEIISKNPTVNIIIRACCKKSVKKKTNILSFMIK